MAKLIKATNQTKEESAFVPILEWITAAMTIAIGMIIPLYLKDGYSKISAGKYDAYVKITAVGMSIFLVISVVMAICNWKDIKKIKLKHIFSALDVTILIYITLVILSYVFSDYKDGAFWGYAGWNMGLYSQISFVIIYFMLSRFGKNYKGILFALSGAAFIAIGIGVLHRLMIDPIGVYDGIDEYYKLLFLSTLGQSSWYSSYLCTLLPIGIWAFLASDKTWLRIVSGVYTFIGFASLCTQNSDSAYIALAIFLLVYFWFALNSYKGIERFLEVLILFFGAVKFMYIGFKIFPNQSEEYDVLSKFLLNSPIVFGILIFVIAVRLFIHFLKNKYPYKVRPIRIFRNVIYGGILLFFVFMIFCLGLSMIGKAPEALQGIYAKIPYLYWDDNWGNRRGFTWSFTATMFKDMNFSNKLLGVGPDCFEAYAYSYNSEALGFWGHLALTNAHNEWFTALINYGILGGGLYLAIFVVSAVRFLKYASNKMKDGVLNNSIILVSVAACILTYIGHNFFCYQQILCTPFVFIFIGIGEYYIRKDYGRR